jgi:predicted MFS family arabinose efflux permease
LGASRRVERAQTHPNAGGLAVVAATFVVFGTFWGSWAVAAADIEDSLGLSHGGFGLLLSAALAGAVACNAVGGALAERRGTAPVLAASLAGWAVLLLVSAACHPGVPFAVLLVVAMGLGGVVDVVMNVAATAGLAGRPGALVRFHATFNAGAAIGAAVTGLLLAADVSWRWAWLAIGLVALVIAVWLRGAELPAGEAGEHVPLTGALSVLRREGLLLVATAFAVSSLVEGGVELWGVLFLRTTLPSGLAVGVVSAVAAYLVATTARSVLGPTVGRRGPVQGVAAGAGTAMAGILLLALADSGPVAGLGLVLAAGGISLCWPLLLSLASADRARPGAVVGAVTAVGYTGFVVGPTVVGALAAGLGLRAGLVLLAGFAAFVAAAPALSGAVVGRDHGAAHRGRPDL